MEELYKTSQKLLKYIRDFQVTDLIGLGSIIGTNQDQEFEDYLTELIVNFQKLPKKRQKELVKLAKNIKEANENMKADPNLLDSVRKIKEEKKKEKTL